MVALKNLLRRKVRSLFAILQIAVAIAAFVSIVGITKGLRAQFYEISQILAYDLVVRAKGSTTPIFSTVSREEAEAVAALPEIGAVSLIGVHALPHEKLDQPITMLALDPGSTVSEWFTMVQGEPLAPGGAPELLIGELMAEQLDIDVGETIDFIGGQSFTVVGIFRSPLEDVPFLEGQAIMSLEYMEINYRRQPLMFIAHLRPGHVAESPDEVQAALAESEAVAPKVNEVLDTYAINGMHRLEATTVEGFLDSFKQAALIDSFALAISLLAALVSGIGVTNTMLMSVFDRTREIGLLRAIGWSRSRIVLMIETEGALLALAGGLLGIPFGWLLIQASKLLIQLGWLEVSLDPPLYAQAVVVATVIGLLGALYPALRAANLQPTEALRYE